MSLNKIMLIGRLGVDPVLKDAGSNQVCNFTLATNEIYNDKNGERQERTIWHSIVVWGKMALNCNSYLKKGSMVYVEGKMDYQSFEQDGIKKVYPKVIARNVQFLDSPKNVKSGDFMGKEKAISDMVEKVFDGELTINDEIPF